MYNPHNMSNDYPSLLDRTRELLKKDTRTLAELSRLTGINYFWLRNLKLGRTANPGVKFIEQLNKFLSC
jgi:hypothetical protein